VVNLKHIVQFSGGAASAVVAKMIADEFGKENTVLLFHDTKAEHEDAYRFRRQVSQFIGVPITEMSDGRSLWELIDDHNCLPSFHIPFCTDELKLKPAEIYLQQFNSSEYILYNGFGLDEWQRVQKSIARNESKGRIVKSPLFEKRINNAKDIIRTKWKICLPEPYKYLKHNNCIPCFKAGIGHFFKVWKHYPKEFQMAIDKEKQVGHTVFQDHSLEEYAEIWKHNDRQTELDFGEDTTPCMCAL
jgi:3'-phosphoadenosine 5'-phosphosulfate sulfotransferase (PAPS reductase)/FAD synthetase